MLYVMVYVPHARVIISGTLGPAANPAEVWSTGFAIGHNSGAPYGLPDNEQWADIRAAIQAWYNRATTLMSVNSRITRLRVVAVGADGLWLRNPDGSFVERSTTGEPALSVGSSNGEIHPFQCAYAVTLVTPRVGRSGKGRMFLPCPAVEIQADGRILDVSRDNVLASTTQMLDEVNGALGGIVNVIVASSMGFVSPVTSVRAGRVIDTQRRRRSDLNEEYESLAL